jgi:hypothetical protein
MAPSFRLGQPIPTTAADGDTPPRGKRGTMARADTHTERVHLLLEIVVEMPDKPLDADRRADEIGDGIAELVDGSAFVYTGWTKAIDWERAPDG